MNKEQAVKLLKASPKLLLRFICKIPAFIFYTVFTFTYAVVMLMYEILKILSYVLVLTVMSPAVAIRAYWDIYLDDSMTVTNGIKRVFELNKFWILERMIDYNDLKYVMHKKNKDKLEGDLFYVEATHYKHGGTVNKIIKIYENYEYILNPIEYNITKCEKIGNMYEDEHEEIYKKAKVYGYEMWDVDDVMW